MSWYLPSSWALSIFAFDSNIMHADIYTRTASCAAAALIHICEVSWIMGRGATVCLPSIASIERVGLKKSLAFTTRSAKRVIALNWMHGRRPERVHAPNLPHEEFPSISPQFLVWAASNNTVSNLTVKSKATTEVHRGRPWSHCDYPAQSSWVPFYKVEFIRRMINNTIADKNGREVPTNKHNYSPACRTVLVHLWGPQPLASSWEGLFVPPSSLK